MDHRYEDGWSGWSMVTMLVPCKTKDPRSINDARGLICKAQLSLPKPLTKPEGMGELSYIKVSDSEMKEFHR